MKALNDRIINSYSIFLFSIAVVLQCTSCERGEQNHNEFSAFINDKKFEETGVATKNITSSGDTNFVIHTKSISSAEKFYFWNIPDVNTTTHLNTDDFIGKLNIIDSDSQIVTTYTSISGELIVTPLDNDLIEGAFNLIFVNTENNLDTLDITSGRFKITYSTIWSSL